MPPMLAPPAARKAQLEFAFRLVRVATEPAEWTWAEQSLGAGTISRSAHRRRQLDRSATSRQYDSLLVLAG
jgi:hypothetical protein